MMRTALPSSSSVSLVPMQARTLGRCLQEFQETFQLYQSYGLSWSYLASFTSNPSSTVWSMTSSQSTDTTQGETTSSTGNSSLDRALQWATPSTAFQVTPSDTTSCASIRSTSWPRSMDVGTGGMLTVPASSDVNSVTSFQRDYMLDQDGFEDWSWLCDQRPYDSLVRESLSDSFATFTPEASLSLEHLGNEELSNSYATKLRSTQQMKWFTQSSRVASEGVESPWFVLNEQRADRLLWNQGWFVSQAQARQMLQHKKIGILRAKDNEAWRRDSDASCPATYASVASPRTFVKPGDILYWRGSRPKTSSVGTSQRLNHYTFPSSLHVGSASSSGTSVTPWVPMIHSPHLSVHVNQPTLTSCLTSSEQGMDSQVSSDAPSWLWDHALYPYCVRSQRVLCRDLLRLPQSLLAI